MTPEETRKLFKVKKMMTARGCAGWHVTAPNGFRTGLSREQAFAEADRWAALYHAAQLADDGDGCEAGP